MMDSVIEWFQIGCLIGVSSWVVSKAINYCVRLFYK